MKTIENTYRYILFIVGIFFLTTMVSCEKHSLADPDNTTDRLFRPPAFAATVDANEVTLSWVPIADATYVLEVSKDNLVFETELQQIELGEVAEYVLTDLWSSTRYSARIKAVSKNPSVKDSEFTAVTFQTGVENIFYTPDEDEDITENSVLLKWVNSKEVDKVTVSAPEIASRTLLLSSANIESGEILVDGLDGGINYTFRIFKGDMLRGSISLSTTNLALLAPVFINFGMDNTTAGWNNLTNILQVHPHANATLPLIDKEGNDTEAFLVYAAAFGGGARHTTGAQETSIPGFEMPDAVSRQGFYGGNGTEAVLRLEGLRPNQPYDICFYASRMNVDDNRETKYTASGSNEVITQLDATNNTSEIACAIGVIPDTDGHIRITLQKGDNNTSATGFYSISAMRLTLSAE